MTNDEIQQLRKGDIVYVPFVVDKVDRTDVYCRSSRLKYCRSSRLKSEFVFYPEDISSWERPRRKFRKWGDVIATFAGNRGFVAENENAKGVRLDFLPDDVRRDASELPDDMTPFQNLLIERIKKIKSPELLLTNLVVLSMTDDEMMEFYSLIKNDNN